MSTQPEDPMTIKQEIPVTQTDLNAYNSLPPRFSKHQGVFGKFAASEAATLNGWNSSASTLPMPGTPVIPSLASIPGQVNLADTQLMTPSSSRTVSPNESLSTDNSPLFGELSAGEMQNWESLFLDDSSCPDTPSIHQGHLIPPDTGIEPAQTLVSEQPFKMSPSSQDSLALEDSFSFELLNEDHSLPEQLMSSMAMNNSSNKASSFYGGVSKSSSKKLDELGFTMYKRKPRTMPLKPVEIPEDGDDLSAKRAKNTEAARRSRARKLERMSQLEDRVRELLDENESLKAEIARLKAASN